jgi:hypothetical protein
MTDEDKTRARDLTREGKTIREIAVILGFNISSIKNCVARLRQEGDLAPKARGRKSLDPMAQKEYAPKGDHKGFLKELAKAYQKPIPSPPKPNSILHQIHPDAPLSCVGSPALLCERS